MKLRTITFTIAAVLMMCSCVKENDFEALKHPLIIEGDFDPVLGLPLAKMTANMAQIVGLLDSAQEVDVYIDSNDLVSLRFNDTAHTLLYYKVGEEKNTAGGKGFVDSIRIQNVLSGKLNIPLFQTTELFGINDLEFKGMYFSFNSVVKAFVTDSLRDIFSHGVRLYFDSVVLQVNCLDGFSPVINLNVGSNGVSSSNLIAGQPLEIMNNYDISQIVNHKPLDVSYSVRLNVVVPANQWQTNDSITYIDSIGVDSIVADFNCHADFPMQVYCGDIEYKDTAWVNLNMSLKDSTLDKVERMLNLDSSSCLVIESRNWLPIDLHVNLALLDSSMNILTSTSYKSDSILYGAPLHREAFAESYVSSGYTKSRIVIPISFDMLKSLRKTKYLKYTVGANTSRRGVPEERPTVSVRGSDKLELRTYIVVAPHVRLASDPIRIFQF